LAFGQDVSNDEAEKFDWQSNSLIALAKELNGQPAIKVILALKEMNKKMIRTLRYTQNLFRQKRSCKITIKVFTSNMKMKSSTKKNLVLNQKKFKIVRESLIEQ